MSVPTHQQDLIALLEERGFVHQCTDRDGLAAHLAAGPATAYLGFDATADSLHVGHLQGLMLMRWLQKAGHRPLLLIGGATTDRRSELPRFEPADPHRGADPGQYRRHRPGLLALRRTARRQPGEQRRMAGRHRLPGVPRPGRPALLDQPLADLRRHQAAPGPRAFAVVPRVRLHPAAGLRLRRTVAPARLHCNSAAPTSGRTSSAAWSCRDARAAPNCSA